MRLLATLTNEEQSQILSSFLARKGIENQLEVETNTDWGSSDYGTINCKIWVYDEDQFAEASKIADEFFQSPSDQKFQMRERAAKTFLEPVQTTIKQAPQRLANATKKGLVLNRQSFGVVTLYLLILCGIIFGLDQLTTPSLEQIPPSIPYIAVFSSPIKKELLYDYPQAFEIIDKIAKAYGKDKLQNIDDLPPQGKFLLEQFYHTPYWQGLYEKIVLHLKNLQKQWDFNAPMFEKIRQGEIWRLFTPSLMHYDIFHIFFNMIWLIVLGRQMEQCMGKWKYLLFIILTGIFSNTCQYLMTGVNFVGFSGVLCAMLTFIWVRQRKAAWEGYQLQGATFAFIAIFILAMFALQTASFFLEVYGDLSLSPGIANTAHLSGAVLGFILGHFNFFAWKNA